MRALLLLAPLAIGAALTILFWLPLWAGGGFAGGDVYYHTLPEKLFLVDWWQRGEFPLWNNRFGNGFPLVAEGMTAPFYPPSLLFYGQFDANAAYNANHLLHYALCFAFTWLYVRKLGLSVFAAALAGLIYTYGWFPARKSWEVAIIAGAYLPLFLWLVECWLETRRARWLGWLALAIGLQVLAGQYNLAFITHVVVGLYVLLRMLTRRSPAPSAAESGAAVRRWSPLAMVALAGLLGYGVAAVAVLPTYELKQRSPRAAAGARFDPLEGSIPAPYLAQVVLGWDWYRLDEADFARRFRNASRMESHLYFGLAPLALLAWSVVSPRRRGLPPGLWGTWCVIGGFALLYALGWLPFVARHVPGFDFFRGPSRYGLATTFAVAVLAAGALDSLLAGRSRAVRLGLALAVWSATAADLGWVSRQMGESRLTWRPAIDRRAESELARVLARENDLAPVRMLSSLTTLPAENVPSLYGVSTVPPALALPPLEYAAPHPFGRLVQPLRPGTGASREELAWLRKAGVTHVLSPQRLDAEAWQADLVWRGRDELLEREWQAGFSGPIHLYRLRNAPGRVWFADRAPGDTARVVEDRPHRVVIEASTENGGRLVLADLAYPGWEASIDDTPVEGSMYDGRFRAVQVPAGRHRVSWEYRSRSVYYGAAISLASLLAAGALGCWRRR
ncbi:MAG: hypothetical protein WED34_12380 [Planctomycetales bacterium]